MKYLYSKTPLLILGLAGLTLFSSAQPTEALSLINDKDDNIVYIQKNSNTTNLFARIYNKEEKLNILGNVKLQRNNNVFTPDINLSITYLNNTPSSEDTSNVKPTEGETSQSNYIGVLPDGIPLLVNRSNPLSKSFVPNDLFVPNVSFASAGNIQKNHMTRTAGEALENMFRAALDDGVFLYAVSGYRSYSRQSEIYSSNVKSRGKAEADKYSAEPGKSEHQTGLAMDISSKSVNLRLDSSFGNTKEGIWLKDNAHEFGFILRYPKEKKDITGFNYEPWHFRYVGVEIATFIKENDLTLEEYVQLKTEKAGIQ